MLVVVPKVTTAKLGDSLIVDRSSRIVRFYKGTRLTKSYRCAVGMARYPTPLGTWRVVAKHYMPSWYNPGSAWAAGMPRVIPPGPYNPLGTRALALSASNILIHGTSKDWSIGTAASHGCIRMHRWDIENLYPRVRVGTRVVIVN
jgi:lipoprotein-anchoring transpeptidase ErfK/SrfK